MPSNDDDAFRAWFEGELAYLHSSASEWIARGNSVPPLFLVFSDDNQCAVLPVPMFANVADKNRVARLHRVLGKAGKAVFVCECWTLNAALSQADAERLRTSRDGIEHDPERTESIMWNVIEGKRQLLAIAQILRPSNTLGPLRIIDPRNDGWKWTGRFAPGRDDDEPKVEDANDC
jgi:hypothetical protein